MTLHKLNAIELDQVLVQAGFPKTDVQGTVSPSGLYVRRTGWSKAMAESGGTYDIVSPENPDGSFDYGLFQINDKAHKKGLGADWANILDPVFNASLAWKWTDSGKNWGTWGLGLNGWAGSLHTTNLAAWSMIQQAFGKQYAAYPAAIEKALTTASLPGVHLDLLMPGLRNDDVMTYQKALRSFLTKVNRLGNLNPSGPTGFYGTETANMTDAVYRYQASVTGDLSWLRGVLTTPGPKMLTVIGLKAL